MIVDRKGDQEFAVSFDPDSQLLVEKGQVNLIKDGQGTPLADYHLLPGHRRTNCHSPKRTAPDVFGLQTGLLFQPQSCFDHGRDSVLQRQPLKIAARLIGRGFPNLIAGTASFALETGPLFEQSLHLRRNADQSDNAAGAVDDVELS